MGPLYEGTRTPFPTPWLTPPTSSELKIVWALAAPATTRGARTFMVMDGWSEEMSVMRRVQMEVGEKGGSLGIYN